MSVGASIVRFFSVEVAILVMSVPYHWARLLALGSCSLFRLSNASEACIAQLIFWTFALLVGRVAAVNGLGRRLFPARVDPESMCFLYRGL